MATRFFSTEELELLATPLSIRLERAATSRQSGALSEITDLMEREHLAAYDPYVQWVGVLQKFIIDAEGETAHASALRVAAMNAFDPSIHEFGQLEFRGRIEMLARHLRASGSTFWVRESTDRVRFSLDPWGGGVRQWRPVAGWQAKSARRREGNRYIYRSYGSYAPGGSGLAMLAQPSPLTQGRAPLPSFLAAEVLYFEIRPLELLGAPIAVITLPDSPGAPTHLDVHKNPADVPEEIYARNSVTQHGSLQATPAVGDRLFTADELEDLAVPLSLQVEAAGAAGRWDQLLEISKRMDQELVCAKDPLGLLITGLLSWIARELGESAAERALQRTAEVVMAPFIENLHHADPAELIRGLALSKRAHGSTFWIEENDDTVVFTGTIGACNRMWRPRRSGFERVSESRIRYPTFGAYEPPFSFHRMREARGMTYGEVDYPIYGCHCHMLHEIFAIDVLGYPLWTCEHKLDDPDAESLQIHYKDPSAWPALYYTRVGREKPHQQSRMSAP